MIDFDIQNIASILSGLFGAGGFFYGWKKRKLSNFDLIQSLYHDMLVHLKETLDELKAENKRLKNDKKL